MIRKWKDHRTISVAAFSCLFAYLLSFVFEGQVLYSTLGAFDAQPSRYILAAIFAHFAGLFTGSFFIKTTKRAKYAMVFGMAICLIATVPFLFAPSGLWFAGLAAAGYAGGCGVAAWGYFLKSFTPKNERIKSCADVLIFSNIIMIAINMIAIHLTHVLGLLLSMLCLILGGALTAMLPAAADMETTAATARGTNHKSPGDIRKPMLVLVLFVAVITITSGLMYQVINPAFEHLTGMVSWYWAMPYVVALAVMRNLPMKANRSQILYIGMAMIIGAFISFMLLQRNTYDYLIVDTLMLGACGIFDLFWWSILGEMLDYSDNPSKTFGIGLSSNVFGVLCGSALGMSVASLGLSDAEVAVIALTVVCITLIMLPPLNHRLVLLLKSHAYLAAYENMSQAQQTNIVQQMKTLDPLTAREQEVLHLLLSGKSNSEIAASLFISENTVKTHTRSIFSKYDVSSRAELISTLLKNQKNE